MSFPRYGDYTDSGVEWLGALPNHWKISSLKHFVSTVNGLGFSSSDFRDEGVPFIRAGNIKNKSITQPKLFLPEEVVAKYERVILTSGDVVISMVGSDPKIVESAVGQVGIVPDLLAGAVPNQNVVILREHWDVLLKQYLFYTLCSSAYRNHLNVFSHKLANQSIISSSLLVSARFTVPPLDEQKAISSFLDVETSKIDGLVSEQRRLTELLKEKRQAVISHAVTKGLNPNAPMKPSGTQWLGEVPQHWEVLELKRLIKSGTSITYGIVQAGPDIESGIPYIRTSDMSGDELPETGYLRTSTEIDESYARSRVSPGDLVVAIRASLGKGLLVPDFLDGANLTQGTAKVSPGERLTSGFLCWAFNSPYCQMSIDEVAKGTTFREITLGQLRRIRIVVPVIEEQEEIAEYLSDRVGLLNQLQAEAERAIELLQERRTALISAAVTGKIDVRELAYQEAPC